MDSLRYEEYLELVTLLNKAMVSYYKGDPLLMDDATYDESLSKLMLFEKVNPDLKAENSPVGRVGSPSTIVNQESHIVPMLSLDNVFSFEELVTWEERLQKVLKKDVVEYYVEPKLDGLAISLIYEDGILTKALTRGDGLTGEDVTLQIRAGIKGIPLTLSERVNLVIRGEIIMLDEDFDKVNNDKVLEEEKLLSNPRNAAAGALRNKNLEKRLPLNFFAYHQPLGDESLSELLIRAENWGFQTTRSTPLPPITSTSLAAIYNYIEKLGEIKENLPFGIDGAVVKVNTFLEREEAGFTSRAPRWAIAYKYPADLRLTKLLGVDYQLGRTGAVTPVARLDPVSVGGTIISNATLHNYHEIKNKDLKINDYVWVRRAGEVIPEVVSVEYSKRNNEVLEIFEISNCPNCSEELDKSAQVYRCINRECSKLASFLYFVSRDCMDIMGLGESHMVSLLEAGYLEDFSSLYTLSKDNLLTLPRMAEKSANNILSQIELSKTLPFSRLLTALGIRNTGRRMSLRLAEYFENFDNLLSASEEDLLKVEGVASTKAKSIFTELKSLVPIIEKLRLLGLNFQEPKASNSSKRLTSQNICITGSFLGYGRKDLESMVSLNGGKAQSSVNKKTNILVAGENAGSKLEDANTLGVKVITLEEFLNLIK